MRSRRRHSLQFLSMTKTSKSLGLYIHIPFCVRKCRYCDFVSFPGCSASAMDAYVDRLCVEIAMRGKEMGDCCRVDSIFVGGGTPSLLSSEQMARICGALRKFFFLDAPEFTAECNPGTIEVEKLRSFKELGVNRISLGVQSLSNPVLKKLGRIHNNETAVEAMRLCRELGFNYNVDLMFGVPGQTLRIWKDTLKKALAEDPDHVSFYSLQLEEGTPMCEAYRSGDLELPSWEENREMYAWAVNYLKEQGYCHYEISNAAKKGCQCRHNLKYWHMEEYLGLGLAAYSFIGGKRFYNTSDMDRYLYAPDFGCYSEEPDATGLKGDFVFTELRLIDGFNEYDYKKLFGSDFAQDFAEALDPLINDGLLSRTDGRIALTEKGRDFTNPVMERLLEVI